MKYNNDFRENRKYRFIVIIALIISITGLSIAYSAMSESLEIRSSTYYSGDNWLIRFSNVSDPIITGNAKEVKKPIVTYTIIKFDVSVFSVGDSIEYHFDIKNEGNLDAKLDFEPLITNIEEAKRHNILYTFTYEDGSKIFKGDSLTAGTSKSFKLLISYENSANKLQNETFIIDSEIIFNYIQK